MTAIETKQKNFQRIDVDALERLLKVNAEPVEESSRFAALLGYIKKLFSH